MRNGLLLLNLLSDLLEPSLSGCVIYGCVSVYVGLVDL